MLHSVEPFPLTKTQRLYGIHVDPSLWRHMYYPKALRRKIKLAKKRIAYLYSVEPMLYVDHENISDCLNAIKFNTELIVETRQKCLTPNRL